MNGGNVHTELQMHSIPLTCTLRNKTVKFYATFFYHNKKILEKKQLIYNHSLTIHLAPKPLIAIGVLIFT